MSDLNILPSQTSKLASEVEQTRLLGVEMEFHPGPVTMWDWRQQLFRVGIDTFDDGCGMRQTHTRNAPIRADVCGVELRDTERYRTVPACTAGTCSEHPRAWHVQRCIGISGPHNGPGQSDHTEFYELMGLSSTTDRTTANTFLNRGQAPADFLDRVERAFARPTDRNSRLWNLGTDPTAGLELRMPPLSVSERPFEAIARICDALEAGGAEANHSCGLHVHVDMRDKTAEQRYRLAVTYMLMEPLVLAAVAPHRYHNGYNQPVAGIGRGGVLPLPGMSTHMASFSQHNSLLNFSALTEHGTVEWRQLEGTLNADTIKYWSMLALRFTEACQSKWGVKISAIGSVGVTPDAVRSFLKFMDLNRKGLSDDLKGLKDWYIERVRQFSERSSFERRLTPANTNLSALRRLKMAGIMSATNTQVAYHPEPVATTSPSEVGQSFLRFVQQLIGAAGMNEPTGPGPLEYLHANDDAAERIAEYAVDYMTLYNDEDEYDHTLDTVEWRAFARAIYEHDAENVGRWLKTHVLDHERRDDLLRGLNNTLSFWMGYWSYNTVGQDTVSRIFQRNTGSSTCVDF